jgi:hypothetical protein
MYLYKFFLLAHCNTLQIFFTVLTLRLTMDIQILQFEKEPHIISRMSALKYITPLRPTQTTIDNHQTTMVKKIVCVFFHVTFVIVKHGFLYYIINMQIELLIFLSAIDYNILLLYIHIYIYIYIYTATSYS